MRSPAMMKNGMASSGKESMPPNISVGSTAMGTVPDSTMNARPPSPRQKAMGTPSVMVSAKTMTRSQISTPLELRPGWSLGRRPVETEQARHDDQHHERGAHGQGQIEPEDRHAQRQRVLVTLGGEHLQAGHQDDEQEEEREQLGHH